MARNLFLLLSSVMVCLLAVLTGCSGKEDVQNNQQGAAPAGDTVIRKQTEVTVPDAVKGKWKSVKISITDKEHNKEAFVVIEIGKTVKVSGTSLVIKVDNFLPHFIMEGTTLTSSSNAPKNPAAQVLITENGNEIFKGWLFSLYPNTHAAQNSRYGFGLVDFTPAK
jgi:hypothetical protein